MSEQIKIASSQGTRADSWLYKERDCSGNTTLRFPRELENGYISHRTIGASCLQKDNIQRQREYGRNICHILRRHKTTPSLVHVSLQQHSATPDTQDRPTGAPNSRAPHTKQHDHSARPQPDVHLRNLIYIKHTHIHPITLRPRVYIY